MHRQELVQQLRAIYSERRNVLLVGPAGIGKTTILQNVTQTLPLHVCDEASSLGCICDCLERQLGWHGSGLSLIERKNRLLDYLKERREPVAFDHVYATPPRAARFVGHLIRDVPIWIACRSDRREDLGHVWEHLFNFTRVEIPPLTLVEASALVENAVGSGRIQADACRHSAELYRLSRGVPRVLEQLLTELSRRNYNLDTPFGLRLLELDRQIRGLAAATSKSHE